MDTNQITALINAINQQAHNSGSAVTITTLILAAAAPTLFSLVGWLKAMAAATTLAELKASSLIEAEKAAKEREISKALATDTSVKVEATVAAITEVSKAVNGGYGAMVAEIAQLKDKNMGLEKEKAIANERLRGIVEANLIAHTSKVAALEHQLETTIPLTEKTP